ncbi:MAG TPA: HNH endonuclease [Gemmatimonadaceae bacterium]|jgi:5-methylcytosine-specific restriction protein A|nr:HNH endonuclease [Gemmatimonadaceae bacterium]
MAMAPPRPCTHPRCPQLIPAGQQCPDHPRPTAQQRGYTHEWTGYAVAWLVRFPWCGQRHDGQFYAEHSRCVQHGKRTLARVVDHIRSLVSGGARMDPKNHQSLCRSCNTLKG